VAAVGNIGKTKDMAQIEKESRKLGFSSQNVFD
jgi:hypothetical protein